MIYKSERLLTIYIINESRSTNLDYLKFVNSYIKGVIINIILIYKNRDKKLVKLLSFIYLYL